MGELRGREGYVEEGGRRERGQVEEREAGGEGGQTEGERGRKRLEVNLGRWGGGEGGAGDQEVVEGGEIVKAFKI